MKKSILVITSMLALAGALQAPVASASLSNILFKFDCPNNLSNLGSFLSGIGSEQLGNGGTQKNVQFKGDVPAGTPLDMSGYFNSRTKYDAGSGKVTCQFESIVGDPVVYVSLNADNARNGIVVHETTKEIRIQVPMGVAAK